ncbi:MAG TPA: TonB family protein [Verrucomicrobiae bacterium]
MNPLSAETHPLSMPPAKGWSWKKTILVILFALAAHLAFVFLLGAKKTVAPRVATNVPVFRLADNSSELVRLTDPTLFALPHAEDVASSFSQPPAVETPSFRYTEAPPFLLPNAAALGAAFNVFMQTNRFATIALNFKPEPQIIAPEADIETALPQKSTWQLTGEISGRRILTSLSAPTLVVNDVIAPSRVQLLVDKSGNIASAVLLETSGYEAADQQALELARTLQFMPADKLMFGEIIFNWHTVPVSTP